MDSKNTAIHRGWRGGEGHVDGEFKFAADSGDTANDFGAVDAAAVPSVGGALGGLDKDFVGTAVVGVDRDSFVEISEISLDGDGFMIATGSGMEANTKNVAHVAEDTKKSAASVDDNKAA